MTPSTRTAEPSHPGAKRGCRICGALGYVVGTSGEHAIARPCECVQSCPLCEDTGFVAVSDAFRAPRRRCACRSILRRLELFDAARIPARHADSTRASFQPSGRHLTAVLQAVTKYLNDFVPGQENRGLVLYGDVGRGKTHLVVALIRELVFRHGVSAKFVEFSHLLADLKSGFDSGRGAGELLDPLVQVDVLAIDELGKGRNTEFEGTVLDELVSRRYNAMRPILASTNYAPLPPTGRAVANAAEAQLGARPPALVDRVGDRVYSRLRETADFVEIKGEDYRELRRRTRPSRSTG